MGDRCGLPSLMARSGRGGTTGRAAGCPASARPEDGAEGAPASALGDGAVCVGAPGRISGRGRWMMAGRVAAPGMGAPGPETRAPSDAAAAGGNGWRGPERTCPGRGAEVAGPGKGLAVGGAGLPGAITATGGVSDGGWAAAGGAAAGGAAGRRTSGRTVP